MAVFPTPGLFLVLPPSCDSTPPPLLKVRSHSADYLTVTSADDIEQRECQLNRFRRLIGELMRGEIERNSFAPWEIELLLDFGSCQLPSRRRLEILRQYQKAVA